MSTYSQLLFTKKKKDPAEFMQVWGRKSIIHMDPAIAQAADNPSIMYVNIFLILAKHKTTFIEENLC
jgi:hypothetical protein